jgi:hypothetical protein
VYVSSGLRRGVTWLHTLVVRRTARPIEAHIAHVCAMRVPVSCASMRHRHRSVGICAGHVAVGRGLPEIVGRPVGEARWVGGAGGRKRRVGVQLVRERRVLQMWWGQVLVGFGGLALRWATC